MVFHCGQATGKKNLINAGGASQSKRLETGLPLTDLMARLVPAFQYCSGMPKEKLTRWCQFDVVAVAFEEGHTEFAFQIADPRTDGGLRDKQVVGSLDKMTGTVNLHEGFEIIYIHIC